MTSPASGFKNKALTLKLLESIQLLYRNELITQDERTEFAHIATVGVNRDFESVFNVLKNRLTQKAMSVQPDKAHQYNKILEILAQYNVR